MVWKSIAVHLLSVFYKIYKYKMQNSYQNHHQIISSFCQSVSYSRWCRFPTWCSRRWSWTGWRQSDRPWTHRVLGESDRPYPSRLWSICLHPGKKTLLSCTQVKSLKLCSSEESVHKHYCIFHWFVSSSSFFLPLFHFMRGRDNRFFSSTLSTIIRYLSSHSFLTIAFFLIYLQAYFLHTDMTLYVGIGSS